MFNLRLSAHRFFPSLKFRPPTTEAASVYERAEWVGTTWMRGNSGRFAFALWHCGLVSAAAAVSACGFLHHRIRATRRGAAQLRPADRAALRHLPHRFRRAHPLRPSLQDRRLHARRRPVSHDPVSRLRRYRQEREKPWVPPISMMAIAGFTNTQAPLPPPTAPYNGNNNIALSSISFLWGGAITDHIGAFAASDLQCATRRRVWQRSIRAFLDLGQYGCSLCGFDNDRRLQRHLRHYRQQQSDRPGSLEHHAGLGVSLCVVELR